MKSKKRVLIVNGQSINENNSTSITLKSIISYFDKSNILEVYYFPNNNDDVEDIQIKSIQLNSKTKILYSLIHKFFKGKIKQEINHKIINKEIQNEISRLNRIKKLVLAVNDYLPVLMKYNKKEIELIDQFKPDVIYTLGASILPLEVSLYFSKKYNIPIVLHHMDNWRETAYTDSNLFKPSRNRLIKQINKVELTMKYGMTISDEMADYYNTLSKCKYVSLMNTVPELKIHSVDTSQNSRINIVYAGGLHLSRWKVLLEIESIVKKINKKNQIVNLNIYTKEEDREKYEKIFDYGITIFNNFLPHNEVYKIYEVSDILIHVEAFDPKLIKFTKYSLSTKIPEYMSTGRPVICYAPNELAVSQYIKKSNCGIAVSNNEELYNGLKLLLASESLRDELGKNGVKVSLARHSEEYKNRTMKEVFDYE